MYRQFLLMLLAARIMAPPTPAHAQTSAKAQIVLPPLSTVQPLEVGPPLGSKDEIELSPTPAPVDYEVEHPLLVRITIFKEEPLPSDQIHGTDLSSQRYYNWMIYVSTDGTTGSTAWWGYADRTSNGGPLYSATRIPRDSFTRIKALIASLPEDDGRIPPRNHKVQVEVATPNGIRTRTYDAANLPEDLLEIFRLTDTVFTPLVPEFTPDSNAPVAEPTAARVETIMAVSHDRGLSVVFPGRLDPIYDIDVQKAREVAAGAQHPKPVTNYPPPSPQVISSDGHVLCGIPPPPMFVGHDTRYTEFRAAWFTSDDRYVVFSTSIPAPLILDARNCQRVEQIPAIPAEAIDFEPSPDWKSAVVVFPSGEMDLWDIEARERVSRIDFGDRVLRSATWVLPIEKLPSSRLAEIHKQVTSAFGRRRPGGFSMSYFLSSRGVIGWRHRCGGRTESISWRVRRP